MSRRPPMSPPVIPGFRYERLLGSGGYSDVFLYEQEMPRRHVAIKVLVADRLDDHARRLVTDEANAMAAVSTHPYIVTIFHADGGTGGNPFLVMEYYPRPNYSVRCRTEQLSVAEVLRSGIQVAGAVETAHRVGIVHRDIKPANVLTSEYGRPGLTDFGIAGLADDSADPAEGLSVPWSPPEIITGDSAGGVASDVYSLGATVYSLLVGRSPYEVPGGSNATLDLLERIQRGNLPPTGRGDVPPSLERLLRHAMARRPEDRPSTAADLARALQDIEVEQRFAMTPLEVRDEGEPGPRTRQTPGGPGSGADEDGTRLKSPTVIQSQAPMAVGSAVTGVPSSTEPGLVGAVPQALHEGATVHRSALVAPAVAAPSGTSDFAPSIGAPPPPPLSVASSSGAVPRASTAGSPPPKLPGDLGGLGQAASVADETSRGRGGWNLVRVAWIGLAIVALLVVVRLAVGAGTSTTSLPSSTSAAVGGEEPVRAAPTAPTGVSVSVDANGTTIASWTAPSGAKAGEQYIVTPLGKAIEEQFDVQPAPGATSVEVPAGTTCVSVRTVRNGDESDVASSCPG